MARRRAAMQRVDSAGAEKKLRQAGYFLWQLESASREIAYNHANALRDENTEHLELLFSACLSAARSVYYILEKVGGKEFKKIEQRWRVNCLKEEVERFKFNRMLRLRDDDVHFGTTGAEALPKYVKEDWRSRNGPPTTISPKLIMSPSSAHRQ